MSEVRRPKLFKRWSPEFHFDHGKVLIVSAYVGLWVLHYMLVHASGRSRDKDGSPPQKLNPSFVVLLTDFIKFFASVSILVTQNWRSSDSSSYANFWKLFRFRPVFDLAMATFPIALFYAVSNNLIFNNLRYFDPTTYLIFSSSRLIMTAVLMWVILGKAISRTRIISIVIIFVGLCMKETSPRNDNEESRSDLTAYLLHVGLLLIQLFSGALASVCNEMVLKKRKAMEDESLKNPDDQNTTPKHLTSIHAVNLCLYMDSILINGLLVFVFAPMDKSTFSMNFDMLRSSVLQQGIVLSLAAVGIVTSFLICHIDSLSKTVASASTVLFTSALGRILFGYKITAMISCSAVFVGWGVHSYTFSDEENDGSIRGILISSFYRYARHLWFIPAFMCLMCTFDTFTSYDNVLEN